MIVAKQNRVEKIKLSSKDAVKMYRGRLGAGAHTYYEAEKVEKAYNNGVALVCVNRAGDKEVLRPAAPKHRQDLFGTFSNVPANIESGRAGTGRYINRAAMSEGSIDRHGDLKIGAKVTGVSNVIPYLAAERSFSSILTAFISKMGDAVNELAGVLRYDGETGQHIHWLGKRDVTGAILTSPWVSRKDLFFIARELHPAMARTLKDSKSGKKNVSEHMSPIKKFQQNITVMRRARKITNLLTGDVEYGGGATPYAMPMEQCEYAIDVAYLINDIKVFKDEVIPICDYYVRLAIGRKNPYILRKRDTLGADLTKSKVVFLDESIWQKYIDANRN